MMVRPPLPTPTPAAQPTPPTTILVTVPTRPAPVDQTSTHCPPTNKVRKRGATEFLGLYNDNSSKAEYWIENVQ